MVNHKENSLFSSLLLRCAHLCTATNAVLFSATKRLRYVELQTLTLIICLGGKKKEPLVGRFENLLSKGVPVTSVI